MFSKLSAALLLQAIWMVNSARILGIFIHSGNSHFEVFYPIMNELAQRSHDVTVASIFNKKDHHPNYNQLVFEGLEQMNSTVDINEFVVYPGSVYAAIKELYMLQYWGEYACEKFYASPIIDQLIQINSKEPFDLVITEIFNTNCILGLIHKMNVSYIGLSSAILSVWHYDTLGIPDTPSYIPTHFLGFTDKMTFSERLRNWLAVYAQKLLYKFLQRKQNQFIRSKFGDDVPDGDELAKKMRLLLLNQHFSLGGSRPFTPNIIEIGGVHISPDIKPLPENIKKIFDNSKDVILISWGSLMKSSTLPEEKVLGILKALEKLSAQIIWKWEGDLPYKPKNVHIQKWLPQRDILGHPKVKLFWTHGGNLGVSEAAYCGVPIVGTPLAGDQFSNVDNAVDRGIGKILYYQDITEKSVYDVLTEVLKKDYKDKAEMLSYLYRNRPMSALASSIWWIEHALVTKENTFAKSNSMNLTWYAYHSIDVILTLFIGLIVILFVLKKLLKILFKICLKTEKYKTN